MRGNFCHDRLKEYFVYLYMNQFEIIIQTNYIESKFKSEKHFKLFDNNEQNV